MIVKGFDEFTNSPEDPFDVYIQYIQFSITPNVNNFMTINGITMDIRHQGMSNQLPNMATARFKVGSAPWNTITTNNTINSAWNPITFPTIGFINKVNTIVQFQIGFWYSGVQVKDPNGQVRIDNITFSTGSTLPIELTTFTATLVPTGIALKWSTASEINNAYVAVERSTDGSRYDEIGRVPGQGDSFDPRDYNYTDESPEKGVNYYRLRQVDYDGAENFSPVVQATFGKTGKLSVYPSPATERLNVTLTETEGDPVRWEVYDVSGRLTLSGTQESDTVSFPIELGNLPEGVYTVQVFVGREVMTERFVKK